MERNFLIYLHYVHIDRWWCTISQKSTLRASICGFHLSRELIAVKHILILNNSCQTQISLQHEAAELGNVLQRF